MVRDHATASAPARPAEPAESGTDPLADLRRVEGLDRWRPTDYERRYLPGLRLARLPRAAKVTLQNTADLHVHTQWSDGDDLDRVLDAAVQAGLDAVAITDHDTLDGAVEARRRVHARGLPIAIIPGVEVSSRDGHIGALFVTRPIPPGQDARETVRLIHDAGGVAVAHHPYVPRWIEVCLGMKLGCRDLIREVPFDAVECTNAVPGLGARYNLAAVEFLRAHQVPVAVTGSSDAHLARLVGKGRTYFAGNEGVLSLYGGLRSGQTRGAEEYWSTAEKVAYWLHFARALLRNTFHRKGSVN